MPIFAQMPEEKERELLPAGTFFARCIQMVYLGTQKTVLKDGKEKQSQKVRISWELPTESKAYEKDGEKKTYVPVVGKKFTLSMHPMSELRPMLNNWRGVPFTEEEAQKFDITKVLGHPCMLTITHEEYNGHKFAKVSGVTAMPKGIECPAAINPIVEISKEHWGGKDYENLPDFIKDEIAESLEWKLMNGPKAQEIDAEEAFGDKPSEEQINAELAAKQLGGQVVQGGMYAGEGIPTIQL